MYRHLVFDCLKVQIRQLYSVGVKNLLHILWNSFFKQQLTFKGATIEI